MVSFGRFVLISLILLSGACGPSGLGGGTMVVDGAGVFTARSDAGSGFVVLTEISAFTPPTQSVRVSSPGQSGVDATWQAHDGAEVKLTSTLQGERNGTVEVDGVEYRLADGCVFALRRAGGRTEILQLEGEAFSDTDLEGRLEALLQKRTELREFLNLDRPVPVDIRVNDAAGGTTMPVWQIEIENLSLRPIREIFYRVLAADAAGNRLSVSSMANMLSLPPGKPLKSGTTLRREIPRRTNAVQADILVTGVAFESGEPERWAPAGN